jgi:hypothetical protein
VVCTQQPLYSTGVQPVPAAAPAAAAAAVKQSVDAHASSVKLEAGTAQVAAAAPP